MPNAIDYITVIEPVYEVSLLGTANYQVWQTFLDNENFALNSHHDLVDIMISAVDSKYMGLRFQEFSISIKVEENQYFLAHAYNSIAPFAWAERVFFQTPYYKGDVMVKTKHLTVAQNISTMFDAKLPEQAAILSGSEDVEEIKVHLPKRLRKNQTYPHFFFARLEGVSEFYDVNNVQVNIAPVSNNPVLGLLRDSSFEVSKWRVRSTARHSKSKTYHGS